MAARPPRLIAFIVRIALCAALFAVFGGAPHAAQPAGQRNRPPQRIISLVPSTTEALFAVGAGPQVIAVGTYDSYPEDVKKLPRVGALLDPDTERIFALRPDLVVVYGSQTDLEARLTRAGIPTYQYRHGGIATVFDSLRAVAQLTGHREQGERVVREVQARLNAVRARVMGRSRPRTLLVIDRQPGTLRSLYASGGVGFLHEMLEIAGGENVFADVKSESVQPSTETLLSRSPEAIVEVRSSATAGNAPPPAERGVWSPLSSVAAVRKGRIFVIAGDYLVVPGPRIAQGVEALARVLHPDAFK
jgi:iron complex transport system substrate-binding protein